MLDGYKDLINESPLETCAFLEEHVEGRIGTKIIKKLDENNIHHYIPSTRLKNMKDL